MTLWVGKDNLLPYGMVLILCAYFIIRQINNLLNLYKDAAGMWHEDRWRPLICSLVNLVVNLILVQFWGLYGILISTIIAMLVVGMPWLTHNLFTVVFHCSWKPYVGRTLRYVVLAAVCCGACIGICHFYHAAVADCDYDFTVACVCRAAQWCVPDRVSKNR